MPAPLRTWTIRNVGSLNTDTVRNFKHAVDVCRIQRRNALVLFGGHLVAVVSHTSLGAAKIQILSPHLAGVSS